MTAWVISGEQSVRRRGPYCFLLAWSTQTSSHTLDSFLLPHHRDSQVRCTEHTGERVHLWGNWWTEARTVSADDGSSELQSWRAEQQSRRVGGRWGTADCACTPWWSLMIGATSKTWALAASAKPDGWSPGSSADLGSTAQELLKHRKWEPVLQWSTSPGPEEETPERKRKHRFDQRVDKNDP